MKKILLLLSILFIISSSSCVLFQQFDLIEGIISQEYGEPIFADDFNDGNLDPIRYSVSSSEIQKINGTLELKTDGLTPQYIDIMLPVIPQREIMISYDIVIDVPESANLTLRFSLFDTNQTAIFNRQYLTSISVGSNEGIIIGDRPMSGPLNSFTVNQEVIKGKIYRQIVSIACGQNYMGYWDQNGNDEEKNVENTASQIFMAQFHITTSDPNAQVHIDNLQFFAK